MSSGGNSTVALTADQMTAGHHMRPPAGGVPIFPPGAVSNVSCALFSLSPLYPL